MHTLLLLEVHSKEKEENKNIYFGGPNTLLREGKELGVEVGREGGELTMLLQ